MDTGMTFQESFENIKKKEQNFFWWGSDLKELLGYKENDTFKHIINDSLKDLISLEIDYFNNIRVSKNENSKSKTDHKLSRFACYMIILKCNKQKAAVVSAREFIKKQFDLFEISFQDFENIRRLDLRLELTEAVKKLNGVAKSLDIKDYRKFTDSGYKGLYKKNKLELSRLRNFPNEVDMFDFMGITEMSINHLRLTLTEQVITQKKALGQYRLEKVHNKIGSSLRQLLFSETEKLPENLPMLINTEKLKAKLKAASLELNILAN